VRSHEDQPSGECFGGDVPMDGAVPFRGPRHHSDTSSNRSTPSS
jgi:hypothetical protein